MSVCFVLLSFLVVVDVVDDLMVLADMRDDVDFKASLVGVHVRPDVFHRESYWLLDFVEVLNFLNLVVWELILGRAKDAFITKKFLALFLSNYFFRTLFRCIKSKRSWIESKWVKESFSPVIWVHIEFEFLGARLHIDVCFFFACLSLLVVHQTHLFFFDQIVDFGPLGSFVFEMRFCLFHLTLDLVCPMVVCCILRSAS